MSNVTVPFHSRCVVPIPRSLVLSSVIHELDDRFVQAMLPSRLTGSFDKRTSPLGP